MSDVFSLDLAGQNASNARAFANPITPEEVEHTPIGVWDGVATGVGKAIPRAFADIARAGELAASVPVGLAEPFLGYKQGELTDKYFEAIDPHVQDAVDYWTPDAASVGTAGQVLGGLTEGLVQLGVGGGNPTLMLGSTVLNRSMDLSRQGVQPDVAIAGGVVEGAATAAGFHVPILGKSLLTRMASGAAGNVAVGTAADLAQQQLLERTGNTEAAKGYNPWSFSGAVEKALMGLAYGAIAHVQSPVAPLERDAALATLNAKHFQQDTAPGTPADPASSVAHQEQIEQAIKQILRGDPVTPTADIMSADFVPAPPTETPEVPAELKSLDTERAAAATHENAAQIMTLYRGEKYGTAPGYRQGGTTWMTEDKDLASRYAESQGEGGVVRKSQVEIKNPFHFNDDTAEKMADYFVDKGSDPTNHQGLVDYFKEHGLTQITKSVREQLLADGYDSVIVHKEPGASPETPSVVLLKDAEEMQPIPPAPKAPAPGAAAPEPGTIAPKMVAAESADPDVVAARRVLTEFPEFRAPTGEVTAEGDPVIGNAHEVLATSDAEIAAAKEQGKAYDAAVNCALQRGLQ